MYTNLNRTEVSRARRASHLLYPIVLVLGVALAGYAQGVGSDRGAASGGGIHTIQGRVFFPAGEAAATKTVKVSLESTTSFGAMSTATDLDGSFRFRSLEAGGYTVVVDAGKEYEVYRETVNIDREASRGGRTIQVNVQLRFRADASNPAFAGVPKNALELYQKGTAAAQKGNPKSAVGFLSQAVALYPNFTQALNDLGAQYLKLLEWQKAAETFEAMLKLKPNDASAHLDLGIALYNMSATLYSEKKMDEFSQKAALAESHLREAVRLKSPGPSAHYYLGMTLIKLKRYSEAQSELEAAIANGGENIAMAHRFLGGLYQSAHKNKEAADELEKYLKLDPKAKDADTIKGIVQKLRSAQ